jgi:hypothetical protein
MNQITDYKILSASKWPVEHIPKSSLYVVGHLYKSELLQIQSFNNKELYHNHKKSKILHKEKYLSHKSYKVLNVLEEAALLPIVQPGIVEVY